MLHVLFCKAVGLKSKALLISPHVKSFLSDHWAEYLSMSDLQTSSYKSLVIYAFSILNIQKSAVK